MQKFQSVYERWQRRELSQVEAGELLGRSERQFRRYIETFEESGIEGLRDGRLGRQSSNATAAEVIAAVLALYRGDYRGWNVKHFHEHLVKRHGFTLSYSLVKNRLQDADLVRPERRKGGHRRRRERKPCVGMMLHQDASKHAWLEGQPDLDLVVTMDDATSEIYSAFLIEEEGTMSTLQGCLEVFEKHGVPASLYTDRGSHYFTTPEAGGKVDKEHPTQVGRAFMSKTCCAWGDRLGVEHIAAYSPQARGRSERMFGTLQDRMVKELKGARIATVAAANRWIAATYLPEHNRLFAHAPALPESGFVLVERDRLVETLCVEEDRVVGRDNTIAWEGRRLQLPESPVRRHYVGATVKVHAYPDGTLGVLHGLRVLGRCAAREYALIPPTLSSMAAGSGPSRSSLEASADAASGARRPSLTAPARAADADLRVGTKKGNKELRRGHEPRKARRKTSKTDKDAVPAGT